MHKTGMLLAAILLDNALIANCAHGGRNGCNLQLHSKHALLLPRKETLL